jgi:hypothetical protein
VGCRAHEHETNLHPWTHDRFLALPSDFFLRFTTQDVAVAIFCHYARPDALFLLQAPAMFLRARRDLLSSTFHDRVEVRYGLAG